MEKKKNTKSLIIYLAIIIAIILVTTTMLNHTKTETLNYSKIVTMFKNGEVRQFKVGEDYTLDLITYGKNGGVGQEYTFKLLDLSIFYNDLNDVIQEQVKGNENKLPEELRKGDGVFEYTYDEPTNIPWWVSFVPYLLVAGVFIALWIYMMNQATGRGGKAHSFGKAKAKLASDDKRKVLFKDVAGADEEKAELQEVVEFLKNPDRFQKLGAKIPHGVLLVGPPGTGKTLLAKAVAGEAGVPFFSISGSDFVEMYVGVGASRVRDLFETARKTPAAIIFIDEIDAVGRHRGAGLGGGHDEREQTLNQLLVEMDGFGTHDGIIVIAATNRPDILDPALLRPGRFDRQITVSYPDLAGREAILRVHAIGKSFSSDVDFAKIAQETVGMTGADLSNLLNEAALLAARKNKKLIGMDDIQESSLKIMVGPQKKSMKLKEEEKKKTAYHEAGHAILGYLLPGEDPVRRISIIPSGRALGYTLNPPTEDKYSVYKNGLLDDITMLLGGRVAEKIKFDDISGGASNDIQRATDIARKMVTQLGMSDRLGPIVFGHDNSEVFLGRDFSSTPNYSDATAEAIDEEIHAIISSCFQKAEKLLSENMSKLDFIAQFLCKYETMDDAQFEEAMKNDNPTIEEIALIAEEQKRARHEENKAAEEQSKSDEEQNDGEQAGGIDPDNPEPIDITTLNPNINFGSDTKPGDNDSDDINN